MKQFVLLMLTVLFSFTLKVDAHLHLKKHIKEHINKLNFKGDVKKVSFSMTDYCVPDSQYFNADSINQDHGKSIWITAGRDSTNSTAICFDKLTENKRVYNTFIKLPHKLNFAIKGSLTLTNSEGEVYKFNNILLGQGHHGSINNWWFGGSECYATQDVNEVTCHPQKGENDKTPDTKDYWCFTRGMGDNGSRTSPNEVYVRHKMC